MYRITDTIYSNEAKRSIKKVVKLAVEMLCLGHSIPYIGNAGPALHAFA